MIKIFSIFLLTFVSSSALAEYRAYQYLVKTIHSNAMTTDGSPQVVTSTLHPGAFKSYYGAGSITIDLLRSWMCPGHTGYSRPACSHPYERMD